MSEVQTTAATGTQIVDTEQRRAILQAGINSYIGKGYRVISQTDTTAQLVKPKKLSILLALCTLGLALLWYLVKKDKTVYLQVDQFGRLTES
jgi:hypothetical protein